MSNANKAQDGGKIVAGLVIFIGFLAFPLMYNAAMGKDPGRPEIVKPTSGKCIESVEYMRANHMVLLDEWRNWFVRDEDHYYSDSTKQQHKMSLTKTCLSSKCHSNVSEFCDRCHDYAGVKSAGGQLFCFDCHLIPKEK